MIFISRLLLGLCAFVVGVVVWSVVAVTGMRVLLFLLCVCACCEIVRLTAMLAWGMGEV